MSIELVAQRVNVLRGKTVSHIGRLSTERDYFEEKLAECAKALERAKGSMVTLGEVEGYINELIDVCR